MQFQCQVPLGSLPINLVLVGNREQGRVVFVKVAPVGVIVENEVRDKVSAWFDEEGFTLFDQGTGETFNYNTLYEYKEIPLMLRWLQQQQLQQPW